MGGGVGREGEGRGSDMVKSGSVPRHGKKTGEKTSIHHERAEAERLSNPPVSHSTGRVAPRSVGRVLQRHGEAESVAVILHPVLENHLARVFPCRVYVMNDL